MSQILLVLAVGLTAGAIVFGITVAITSRDGLRPAEPDGRAVPLPVDRPLSESDLTAVTFDLVVRGYRMDQVDEALRRVAYDIGYKDELIKVLEAEVAALREGRLPEAENLRRTREAALAAARTAAGASGTESPADRSPDEPAAPPVTAPAEAEGAGAASESEPAERTDASAEQADAPTERVAESAPPAPESSAAGQPETTEGPIAAEAGAPAQRATEPAPASEDVADRP